MTLSDISIRNPVMAWMAMAAMILFGIICFTRMGISQLPDVNLPVVNVSITLPNAAPEVVESDVADPVESAVMGVEGVQDVQTTCTQGQASISVFLNPDRDVDAAVQDVQTLVFQAEKHLPTNIFPPVIRKMNPNASPILWMAVTADPPLTTKDLMLYTRDHIQDRFTSLDGVSNVFLGGFRDREINIWADNRKLNARQLTVNDVINAIQHQHAEVPGGSMETPDTQYDIRTMGEAYQVDEFARLPILSRGGAPNYGATRVGDVAQIEDGVVSPITRLSRFDGTTAVGLGIVMQDGYNAVAVGDAAKARMAEVQKQLPPGYHITLNFDTTNAIRDNVHELELTIGLAVGLTSLVCFLFLGSLTSTLNVFLAIPTSLLGTVMLIYFCGFTLNTFTLLALSLSIGVVVDDAIMVLENIVRHQEKGEHRVEAALKGAREVTFAAAATSLAIVAIFLPIAFMTGLIGKFFFQFGITISGAVLISLLEAITLTPMRCAEFVHAADEHSRFNRFINRRFDALRRAYLRVLTWSLRHRVMVLAAAGAIFVGSLGIAKFVKVDPSPSFDQSSFIVNLKLPVTYPLTKTDVITQKCEAILRQRGEVKHLYAAVGGFGGSTPNQAVIFVTMKEPWNRPSAPLKEKAPTPGPLGFLNDWLRHLTAQHLTEAEFMRVCSQALKGVSPDLHVFCLDLSQRGMSTGQGYAVEFFVTGPDWATLGDSVKKIRDKMRADPKLANVNDNFLDGQPEIQVLPDRPKAAAMGVNMDDLGTAISSAIGGYLFQGEYFHQGGHENQILVRVPSDERQGPPALDSINVRNNRGELVPVTAVSDIAVTTSIQQITRDNRQRAIQFTAGTGPGVSQQEAVQEALAICKSVLPPGYSAQLTGTAQANKDSLKQLGFVMLLGIIVAYMVLGSQFNSFVHPVVILLALPFSVTGALFSLWLTGQSLSTYSMIGMILLLGLVKKNSIMLVDFTNQRRKLDGMDVTQALLAACPVRLRPILMTSAATIAGAIPAAVAVGPGAELRQGMSIAIIGGMFFSTLLTLLVVPCAYSLMAGLERSKADDFEIDADGNVTVNRKTRRK